MKVNSKFVDFVVNVRNKYCIIWGGAGSSKSYSICQKIITRIVTEQHHKILVCRKVDRTILQSCFAELVNVITAENLLSDFDITTSPKQIIHKPTRNKIIFSGLDDVEKIKSISGITSIFCEEASEITQDDFIQLSLRLRGKTAQYKQIILSFNPVDSNHWLKKYFFDGQFKSDKRRDELYVLHSTYKDNAFLDEEYKQLLENLREQDENYYKIYALGEWGSRTKNTILSNFEVQEFDNNPYSFDTAIVGLDFGFTHATALEIVGIKNNNKDYIYICKELYDVGITNNDLIRILQQNPDFKKLEIVADSAEQDRIRELQNAGFNVTSAKKGPGSVQMGIDYLKRKKIIIHPSCWKITEQLKNWKYKTDRNGNILNEPIPYDDDTCAALRYAVERFYVNDQNTIQVPNFYFGY